MFGIGTSELLIILAVGLIVVGPQKLPDLAKAVGRAVGEFRKATSEIKETLEGDENLASVKQTFEDAMQEGMNSTLTQETPEEATQSSALDDLNDRPWENGTEGDDTADAPAEERDEPPADKPEIDMESDDSPAETDEPDRKTDA